jgi:Zn-dependent protease
MANLSSLLANDEAPAVRLVAAQTPTNLVLLCFNMLLPMFPMDAGRVLQEVLWSRLGFRRSMKIAASVPASAGR